MDWQPIENAPKDGEPLDLWIVTIRGKRKNITEERVTDAFWQAMPYNGGRWARKFYSVGDVWDLDAVTNWTDGKSEITHWMRVVAPTAKGKSE